MKPGRCADVRQPLSRGRHLFVDPRPAELGSPSNEAFDRTLRMQDRNWGVRDLEKVVEVAEGYGFGPPLIEEMPANNLSLVFRRATPT